MKRYLFAVVVLLAPGLLFAKGPTVRITIEGGRLVQPAEVTDPGYFPVWAGRGAFVNGEEQREGFIVDWEHGAVWDRPVELPQYRVSFYSKHPDERVAYVVDYEHDAASDEGYVYLSPSGLNMSTILRGVEGRWFRATPDWEEAFRESVSGR